MTMRDPICPFCGRDPFHYVDIGVGREAAAVDCCENGDMLFRGARPAPEEVTLAWNDFVEIAGNLSALRARAESAEFALQGLLEHPGDKASWDDARMVVATADGGDGEQLQPADDCDSPFDKPDDTDPLRERG
jgi:hypothetical protein